MTHALAPALDTDTESMEQLAADIQRRWAAGEPPDAEAALMAHPALAAHKPLVLELAYEEFCLLTERGAAPEPKKFARRFPYPESVARLLAVHSAIGRHPSFGLPGRPTDRLKAGDTIDDWVVLRRLGRGGFADVYLVTNPRLGGRPAVLKVSTRGEQEAHTLGGLNHEHLMEVSDAPTVGGQRAMLSPYLGLATGETLVERATFDKPTTAWLLQVAREQPPGDPPVAARSPFPITEETPYPRAILQIAAAIATALEYLHAKKITHRDLKPSNLLIGPTGSPYLLDFNLADDGRSGRVGGTIGYAAPEVLAVLTAEPSVTGEQRGHTVDWFAADVFSFAVLMVELLLLKHPYLRGDALENIDSGTMTRAAAAAHEKLADDLLSLPPFARQLLLDCLHPNPTVRPTATQLARGLGAVLAPPRRRPAWPWVTAAAVVVALSTVGVTWLLRNDPKPIEVDPDREPTEPFARGVWLVRHDQPDVAILAFKQAAETDTSGRADEWLGYCLARAGTPTRAIECDTKALEAGRKTVAAYANRASTRLSTGEFAGALADVDEALKLDQNCKVALISRGIARFSLAMQADQTNPPKRPLPREVVVDLEAGLHEDESRGWVLALLAEAHVWVDKPNDTDRERALWAAHRAVLVGHSPLAISRRKLFAIQLDPEQFRSALIVTDDERLPMDLRPRVILPEE